MTQAQVYRMELEVGPDVIDELGHVSNLQYLRWVLDAAQSHSTAVGYDFGAYQRLGSVFVVRKHEIDYLRPALEGDRVTVKTWVEDFRAASSKRRTEIHRSGSDEVFVRACTNWAFVSLESGRPVRIPQELVDSFGAAAA